jgi:hypothetical protein
MKQEHEYRLETMRQEEARNAGGPASGGGPRTVGGGSRPLQSKSLRGGGGVTRSFNFNDGNTAMNRSNSMGEDADQNYARGGQSQKGSSQAIAVVTAEAVPVEDEDELPPVPVAAAKPPSKSSVFSRMLKGQK